MLQWRVRPEPLGFNALLKPERPLQSPVGAERMKMPIASDRSNILIYTLQISKIRRSVIPGYLYGNSRPKSSSHLEASFPSLCFSKKALEFSICLKHLLDSYHRFRELHTFWFLRDYYKPEELAGYCDHFVEDIRSVASAKVPLKNICR